MYWWEGFPNKKKPPWSSSTSELYRPSDRRMSAKLVPTFADRGCRVVSATDLHSRTFGFLDRSHYYFFQVAPQLYSQGWVDSVPDPLFLRKSGSPGNRTRDLWICSQKLWPLDHRGGLRNFQLIRNLEIKTTRVIFLDESYILWCTNSIKQSLAVFQGE
jgi:hypothetical protein